MCTGKVVIIIISMLTFALPVSAGKLSIVIDDFGYRPQLENQLLALPPTIAVSVLPNSTYAYEMASRAHARGHEVLIHLPMAPFKKQPLEKDTLRPDMSQAEIERIIHDALRKVPFATGLNNHMGSAMTASLPGMQKVMQVLAHTSLYFLDSVTVGSTQSIRAAQGTGVKVIKRKVFLDNSPDEASIRAQFNQAIKLARRDGSAIAIGHPRPSTVRVLQHMVYHLPPDITLVRPSSLLEEPQFDTATATPPPARIVRQKPFHGIKMCRRQHPQPPVNGRRFFSVLSSSIRESSLVQDFLQQWRGEENLPPEKN